MSKYYKVDEVEALMSCGCVYAIRDLPTIEVSEDAISREYLKSFEYINKGDFNSVETIREWIDNAPSVVPQAKEGECPYFIDGVWCNLVGKEMKGKEKIKE